jgi:hypothetical protein
MNRPAIPHSMARETKGNNRFIRGVGGVARVASKVLPPLLTVGNTLNTLGLVQHPGLKAALNAGNTVNNVLQNPYAKAIVKHM